MNRDQKKQIATICTALGTVFISAMLTALFGKQTDVIGILFLITISSILYFVAIIALKEELNE